MKVTFSLVTQNVFKSNCQPNVTLKALLSLFNTASITCFEIYFNILQQVTNILQQVQQNIQSITKYERWIFF